MADDKARHTLHISFQTRPTTPSSNFQKTRSCGGFGHTFVAVRMDCPAAQGSARDTSNPRTSTTLACGKNCSKELSLASTLPSPLKRDRADGRGIPKQQGPQGLRKILLRRQREKSKVCKFQEFESAFLPNGATLRKERAAYFLLRRALCHSFPLNTLHKK